jgi:hypothetical protein
MRRAVILLAGCFALTLPTAVRAADPARCLALFISYPTTSFGEVTPPAALSQPIQRLRSAGCLTTSADLDAMAPLAVRLSPFVIDRSGPAIPPVPVHLGVVTSISDEARATAFFRGLGYRSRGVGARRRPRSRLHRPLPRATHQVLSVNRSPRPPRAAPRSPARSRTR